MKLDVTFIKFDFRELSGLCFGERQQNPNEGPC